MTFDDLKHLDFIGRISAAVYAGDIDLAKEVLRDAGRASGRQNGRPTIFDSIVRGRRFAQPQRLEPLGDDYDMLEDVRRCQALEHDSHIVRIKGGNPRLSRYW